MNIYTGISVVAVIVTLQSLGGELDIPKIALEEINEQFSRESKGFSQYEISNKNDIKKVVCYTGGGLVSYVGFRFEVFPELGFFRVSIGGNVDNLDWFYIQIKVDEPKNIIVNGKDGAIRLRKNIEDKVLACASGLLRSDVTAGIYPCQRDNTYRVVLRQTKESGTLVPASKILISDRGGKYSLESISLFNGIWRDCIIPEITTDMDHLPQKLDGKQER
jgi:hypothetical protein